MALVGALAATDTVSLLDRTEQSATGPVATVGARTATTARGNEHVGNAADNVPVNRAGKTYRKRLRATRWAGRSR